jgi:hypothetical protein
MLLSATMPLHVECVTVFRNVYLALRVRARGDVSLLEDFNRKVGS